MRVTAFIFLTVFHLVASAIFGVFGFAVGIAAIDGEASIFAVRAVLVAWQILFFPSIAVSTVVDLSAVSVGAKVALLLGNSFVWGALAALLWSWCQRRRERANGALRGVPWDGEGLFDGAFHVVPAA